MALLLQSAKPELHEATAQVPPVQLGLPFWIEQLFWQHTPATQNVLEH
jgi:hypothetical protein